MAYEYDIIIVGAGIAGLWLGNRLLRAGFNVVIIENDRVGGTQTLASQGMIHGGQRYTLTGKAGGDANTSALMPQRWEACFNGCGDVDLTSVKFTSEDQIMWSAGNMIAEAAVFTAAQTVNADTKKLKPKDYPEILQDMKFRGAVYRLPEKVLDVKTLVEALAKPLKGRILKGEVTEVLPNGEIAVSGLKLSAQAIIFTAGAGNEKAFEMLKVKAQHTQRRPTCQIMVRPVPYALNGHGIIAHFRPRATVTSYRQPDGTYVWYIGANISENGVGKPEAEALAFAKSELTEMFPHIDWNRMEWATAASDRAEPFSPDGRLPPGPHVHQLGRVLIAWPTKLTFTPGLADRVMEWLEESGTTPKSTTPPPPPPRTPHGCRAVGRGGVEEDLKPRMDTNEHE